MAGISLLTSCLLTAALAAPPQEPAASTKPTTTKPTTTKPTAVKPAVVKKGQEGEKPKQPPCQVTIRVVDPLGEPVPKVGVVLAKEDLQTILALNEPQFRGDKDGKVKFTLPAPEDEEDTTRFTMLLTAPGRLAYSRSLSYPKNQAQPELDLGEIILGKGVLLEGRVRGENGRPLEGAKVTAADCMARTVFTRYGNYDRNIRYYKSHAIADKRGAFQLPGVYPSGMHLTLTADGYEQRQLPAVSIRQPLDVTLRKTGFVSGKVVDDEGKPIENVYVRISYEVDQSTSYEKTKEDGSFKISLRHPHRYRLYVYASGKRSKEFKRTYSDLFDKPEKDVVVKMERLLPPKPKADTVVGILLRVTDAATGGVVEKFKAGALWMKIQPYHQDSYIQNRFRSVARESKMPGELRLVGPKQNQPTTGTVIVEAEGYAQLRIKDVEWPEDELTKLDAKLSKESVVSGVVIDEVTKKPVVGAKVYVVRDDPGDYMRRIYYGNRSTPSNAVTTDEKGAFRIGGLSKGKYKVHASKTDRPSPKPLKVELKDAEERGKLSLQIPRGTCLTGRIVGAEPEAGWRVKMVPRRDLNRTTPVYYSYSPFSRSPGPTAPLARDGKFEFKGLAKGAYDLRILIPRGPRCGPPVELFIDPLRLRTKDINRDFDATEDRPAKIKGKLKVTGAPMPLHRLVVVATDFAASRYYYYSRMDSSLMGARSLLKKDGSFELLVNKGIHQLKVVDLETGVAMLKKEEGVEIEAGQTVTRNLELPVAAVRVSLKPAKEGGKIVASFLEVMVQHPKPKTQVMFWGSSPNNPYMGVSLADGKRKVNLFLPLLETKLAVKSNSNRLHKSNRSGNSPNLADHEFTPKAGETNKVELAVAAPPEVKDPETADKKGAEAAVATKEVRAAAVLGRALEDAKAKKAAEAKAKAKAKAKKKKEAKKKEPPAPKKEQEEPPTPKKEKSKAGRQ